MCQPFVCFLAGEYVLSLLLWHRKLLDKEQDKEQDKTQSTTARFASFGSGSFSSLMRGFRSFSN